jgi:hypothetical protein
MKSMLSVVSILSMICAAFFTLTAIVFCLGMGANAKPPEIRALKLWMLGLTLLGAAGIGGGIFLLRAGQPGWAAGISFAPVVIILVIFAVAMLK